MAEVLHVDVRQERGKRHNRRLRSRGQTPAVLYGHGQENISLSVPTPVLSTAIRHGVRLLELEGAAQDTALIREVQWDAFGLEVLHVDLVRVSADETIDATLRVDTRGEAPGLGQGGIVEQLVHEVVISCSVSSIPDKLELNINSLGLGQSLTAADLSLPPGAVLVTAPEKIIVQCVEPQPDIEEEETSIAAEGVEPEVIGRAEQPDEEARDSS